MLVVCGSELEKNAESLERVESWELKNYQGKKKKGLGNAQILELRNVGKPCGSEW